MATPFRRLVSTFGAWSFFQLVTVAIQLLVVPLLLHLWGTEKYGVWLLLSAVPSYIALSDLGFTASAKNEMVMRAAQGDRKGAVATYQSIFLLLNGLTAVALLASGLILFAIDLHRHFALSSITEYTAKITLLILAGSVFLGQYANLLSGGVRCAGRPAEEVLWGTFARLGETAALTAAAALGSNVFGAAAAIFVVDFVVVTALWLRLHRVAPWLTLRGGLASFDEIKSLFHPSLSFTLLSLSNALMIQGPVVILGTIATPLQIVVFSTSRTLARLGTSGANIFHHTFMPEYSRMFGEKRKGGFTRLLRLHISLVGISAVAYVAALIVLGDPMLRFWTHGKVHAEWPFFAILLFAVAAEMVWGALLIPLAAINRHARVGYIFACLGLVGFAGAYFAGREAGLAGLAAPLLAVNALMIVMLAIELRRAHKVAIQASA